VIVEYKIGEGVDASSTRFNSVFVRLKIKQKLDREQDGEVEHENSEYRPIQESCHS
jgi:hypothetical protein